MLQDLGCGVVWSVYSRETLEDVKQMRMDSNRSFGVNNSNVGEGALRRLAFFFAATASFQRLTLAMWLMYSESISPRNTTPVACRWTGSMTALVSSLRRNCLA